MERVEVVDDARLGLSALMAVGADDAVSGSSGFCLDAVEHRGIVMRDEVGNDDADDLWRLLAQTLGKGVGTIVQFFGQCLHFLLHLLANLRTSVQGTADRGNTHAQFLGDVL